MTDDAMMKRLDAPASVYLLAEHLDAALAAGEDLTSVLFIWPGPPPRDTERIADLMTNIAEDIVYLKTGQIIRHSKKQLRLETGDGDGAAPAR